MHSRIILMIRPDLDANDQSLLQARVVRHRRQAIEHPRVEDEIAEAVIDLPTTVCLTRLPDMGMGTDDQICSGIDAGMGNTPLPRRRHLDVLITPMEIGHDKTAV